MNAWQQWSERQDCLDTALLHDDRPFEEALPLFFQQHAEVHSAALVPGTTWSCEDEVLAGLTDDQVRHKFDHMNTIVWLVWHIARTEDVAMNILVGERPQVLETENWLERLRISRRDTGGAMNDDEVIQLSAQLPMEEVRAYRLAVGQRTRQVVSTLTPAEAQIRVNAGHIEQVFARNALVPAANSIAEYWHGKRKQDLLTMPATRHSLFHLGHVREVRWTLGLP